MLAIASTVLILLYALVASSNENLFWTILAFTGVLFLIPYVFMGLAFLKLRKDDPDTPRPISVPGKVLPTVIAVINLAMLIFSIVAFLLPPEGEGMFYVVVQIAMIVVTQIICEVIISRSEKGKKQSRE